MTTNRSYCCSTNNIRLSNLISLPLNNTNNPGDNSPTSHHIPMMTRYYPRGNFPRSSHTPRAKRTSIWNDPIYYLRSILFPWVLLSLLPLKLSTHTRTGRMLTPHRSCSTRPIRSPTPQHSRIASIRSYSNMSSPQYHRRRTKASHPILSINYSSRLLLHCPPSHRIL